MVRRTGLSAHVIRVWERRYAAVQPERTDTNRRRYSEEQIERLILLRNLTQTGHGIGQVAALPTDELRRLAESSRPAIANTPHPPDSPPPATIHHEDCLAAVKNLDSHALEVSLERAASDLGGQGLLQKVIAPLAMTLGELWRTGVITAAHEHFASAVIRVLLGRAARPFAPSDHAPVLVVGTPSGQLHELGALLAAAAAANLGWHVTYLGAGLPAAEFAGAARQSRARAVALSLVYPEDDSRLAGELTRLRDLLPSETTVLVGGRAAPAYHDALESIGALQIRDLDHLCTALEDLRKPSSSARPVPPARRIA